MRRPFMRKVKESVRTVCEVIIVLLIIIIFWTALIFLSTIIVKTVLMVIGWIVDFWRFLYGLDLIKFI